MKHLTLFESFLHSNDLPEQITGNDDIVWVRMKKTPSVSNYVPFYKGHNIDVGGYNVKTRKELDSVINDYVLSIQWYNKLKHLKETTTPYEQCRF